MNEIREQDIRALVERIVGLGVDAAAGCEKNGWMEVPTEISARHVHLMEQAVETLFGPGAALHPKRDLSQPGQFLCEERVRLIGPKGVMENIAVLGPVRSAVQVELSLTDARTLGVKAPIRQSGDLSGAGDVYIVGPCGMLNATGSVIAAKAHVHMTPENAKQYGVQDGQTVQLRLQTDRPITLGDVVVRVSEKFALAAHIDFDEANAAHFTGKEPCAICCAGVSAQPAAPAPVKQEKPSCQTPAVPAANGKKQLITEAEAVRMVAAGLSMPEGPNIIVTPLAKDAFLHAKAK